MKNNPFVLPGFGQTGPMGENPILASMEMMRQAWEGLASSGGMDAATMGRIMSVEEMDKRIADLRAVENWLRMNLSMLNSTIQGLEVQRATVATLKSFVDTGMASMAQPGAGAAPGAESPTSARKASSLDEVLGIRPGPDESGQQADPEPSAARRPADEPAPSSGDDAAAAAGASGSDAADQPDVMAAAASAAQGWWNLLQQQFQTLAAATAASAEGAMADLAQAGKQAGTGTDTGAKAARKTPAKAASRSTTAKKAGSKTAAKKAAKTSKAAKKAPTARKTTR